MRPFYKQILKFTLFLGVSVFLFWLVYRDQNWSDLLTVLREDVNYTWVWVAIVMGIASHVSRALRWQLLTESMGYKITFWNSFMGVLVGYFANLAIPRMGEFTRCGVFHKYGITRADFDSCMYYYSARPTLFAQIYDVVIDSLNRQVTSVALVLQELRSKDSLNLFPVADTLVFDSCYTHILLEIDSLLPGQYKFGTKLKFDVPDKGKKNRIVSFFVSSDNQDTLKVADVNILTDTLEHDYRWSQYIDSTFQRLVIKFVDSENLDKLEERQGRAWNMELFRPYISRETERQLRLTMRRP